MKTFPLEFNDSFMTTIQTYTVIVRHNNHIHTHFSYTVVIQMKCYINLYAINTLKPTFSIGTKFWKQVLIDQVLLSSFVFLLFSFSFLLSFITFFLVSSSISGYDVLLFKSLMIGSGFCVTDQRPSQQRDHHQCWVHHQLKVMMTKQIQKGRLEWHDWFSSLSPLLHFSSFPSLFLSLLLSTIFLFPPQKWFSGESLSCISSFFLQSLLLLSLPRHSWLPLPPNLIHTVNGNYILRPNIFNFLQTAFLICFQWNTFHFFPSFDSHFLFFFSLLENAFLYVIKSYTLTCFLSHLHFHFHHRFMHTCHTDSLARNERKHQEGEKKQEQEEKKGRKCNKKWNSATTTHPTVFPWMMDSDIFNRKTVSPEVACCPSFSFSLWVYFFLSNLLSLKFSSFFFSNFLFFFSQIFFLSFWFNFWTL